MKHYDIRKTEEKIRKFWEREKIYKFDPKKKNKVYSIDTPPPYISGRMHIGHAFSYSQQDFIIRYMRMKGKNIFYPFGTDDNGLPTERFIEKTNNIKSKNLGRLEFIKLCQKTLKEITPSCIQDFIDLGISCDYSIYYSTIDKHSQRISQKSFIDLYNKGKIYKKAFPTIWCPECQTAIAQAELEDKEFSSHFSTIKFECGKEGLPIATTRPELIPACVAIFINPKDKRYKNFIGKKAKVPLFGFEVPIIADKSAEIEKGTGIMMVCSYGDKFDVDSINRHKFEPKIIFNYDGTLKIERYKGMKITEARKKILEDLKQKGLITDSKSTSHIVNVHDKCGTEIEFLPTPQWFIRILDKKKKWIELGRKINWYPEFMRKRYENWVNGLEWDWSISRDRHFGVPIPAWECVDCGEIILAKEKELPVDPLEIKKKCPKCGKFAEPEIKVLDTWATSSLTPQIAATLPQAKGKAKLPFSLRPNAHDIIRTWAFYTIVKAYLHENKIPWEDIVISGIVSLGGEKISKSKGNIVDPIKVMSEHGADSLRYWASSSKLGGDLDYQEDDIIAGKRLITKLFNASKFVFMAVGKSKPRRPKKIELLDELFLEILDSYVSIITSSLEEYEYSRAKSGAEELFWKVFCDNYLEIIKRRIYHEKGNERLSAQYTLYHSFLTILKLIAPIMPFITEEIYQIYYRNHEKRKSIHICEWPESKKKELSKYKEKLDKWNLLVNLISNVRKAKTEAKKPMNSEIVLTVDNSIYDNLEGVLKDLKNVVNAKEIKEGKFNVEFV